MTIDKAIQHLENMKWLKGYDNTTVDEKLLSDIIDEIIELLKSKQSYLEQVAADYGLTPDGVSFALEQYQRAICEITQGRMSKLSYYADDILRVADEVKCNGCEYTEPRLLTLEEIQHTDAVWLETHGWQIQGGDIHETVLRRMSDFEDYVTEFADNDDGDITCVNSTLGIDWRCWNIKPSYEQRKNTPWKE